MDIDIDVESLDVEVPELSQVGLVVEDLEDGMDRWGAMLGLEPWRVMRFEPPGLSEATYQGEEREMSFRLAVAEAGPMDVELIEPLEGENSYTEHLAEHGEGIHHVACFDYDDPRAVAESYIDAGVPVVQSGVYHGSTFWYFDFREAMNGTILEIVEPSDEGPAEPDRMYHPNE